MASPPVSSEPRSVVARFLSSEAAGGILLMLAAAAALVVANSSFGPAFHRFLEAPILPPMSQKLGPTTLHLLVNDGLMAIFFWFVGLEIKREWVDGRLATWQQRRLPIVAAIAGMVVPAAIYLLVVRGEPGLANGWAIPAATDIAFAIGVLSLLGTRAPVSLKLFLVTVAIVDDMGAVAIIALFYTASLKLWALGAAAVILAVMFGANRAGVRHLAFYAAGFAVLWWVVLQSGVHATIAGVLAAFTVPLIPTPHGPDSPASPLHTLEHALAPWVAFLIVPVFGFVNAGVRVVDLPAEALLAPLPVGIALGLFLGKQLGILGAVWVAVKSGFAQRPRGTTWPQIWGVSLMCGIGFTMSLFIGGLAFREPLLIEEAKIGTLGGSLLSALVGYAVMRFAPLHPRHAEYQLEDASEMVSEGDIDAEGEPEPAVTR